MSQQAIGKILLMPKGDYSGSATYNMLDWVRYDSKAWVCKLDNTVGVVPSEGANWTLLAADGTVSGSVAWSAVTSKPFSTIDSSDFDVDGNDELNIKRDTFGTVRVVSGGTTTDLEASGDSVVEIDAGTNVTITADDSTNPKKLTINASGGGGGASALNDLSDVTITSASNGQVLTYDNANSKWINQSPASGSLDIQQNGVSAYTGGSSFNANSSTNATANIITDIWSSTATADSSGNVVFDNLDNSYGYDLYSEDVLVHISSMTKGVGTNSGIKLTFETDAPNGTVCKLRILR